MGFAKWESFLEDHIEGFFNKKFESELEPAEVKKQLQREIIQGRKQGRRSMSVPNHYHIYMSGADYGRLCSQRFQAELYTLVEKQVILEDAFMDGELCICLEKKPDLSLGLCQVQASFATGKGEREADAVEPDTIVLDRSQCALPLNLPEEHKTASLTAVEGPDLDSYLEFGEKQIYIGRREKNEFILTDPEVSRLHAYIAYERHRHVLHDAESMNGTSVNGRAVQSVCLCNGDKLEIGSTVLLYEVV
jgi:hypothetical protein